MSNTNRTSTELIDRYLQAVRFWLPKTHRQEDLLEELKEDLHSQIEEKENELGRPLAEGEVAEILKRCGAPMVVAGRLGPKQSLIGPTLYPIYMFVMKMVVLWILVSLFIVVLGPINMAKAGGEWASALAGTLGELVSAMFIAAGVITLIFAVVERTVVSPAADGQAGLFTRWDPLKLPPLQKPERKPSKLQTVCELVFGFFGLVWLLLLPEYPFLILGPAVVFLKAAPIWHLAYPLIVGLSALALLRVATILARPQWSLFPLASLLLHEVLGFVFLSWMLSAVSPAHTGEWHPFVMLAESFQNSARFVKVPSIVNVSILISVLVWWFVQGIAIITHAWQLLSLVRRNRMPVSQATSTSLQAR